MTASSAEHGPDDRLVIVSTELGLDVFTAEAVQLSADGYPANLVPGTEYAVLSAADAEAFIAGDGYAPQQPAMARPIGAFSLAFANGQRLIHSRTAVERQQ